MNLGVDKDYFGIVMSGALSPIQAEMNRFDEVKRSDPIKAKQIVETSAMLIDCCRNGQMSRLRRIVCQTPKEDLLLYFTVKMLKECLVHGHLIIADQMIKSGFPLTSSAIPNVLLDAIKDPALTDENAHKFISFLNDHKFDMNSMDRATWETAMHTAVRRQFIKSIETLIALGSDVNAVAQGDIQPLHVADAIEDDSNRMKIIELLIKHGARRSWRQIQGSELVGFSSLSICDGLSSTMVSAKGGGGKVVYSSFNSSQLASASAGVTSCSTSASALASTIVSAAVGEVAVGGADAALDSLQGTQTVFRRFVGGGEGGSAIGSSSSSTSNSSTTCSSNNAGSAESSVSMFSTGDM